MPLNPRILLAFANDAFSEARQLDELQQEMVSLGEILQGHMEVTTKPEASQSVIVKAFKELGEDIHIFHFAGHASGEGIETQEKEYERRVTLADGLAEFIGQQQKLKLAFLNGCATEGQVKYFHQSHIPAVIATRYPIGDRLAREFSEAFYDSLAKGRTIQKAFDEAKAQMRMSYQEYANRSLVMRNQSEKTTNEFPYTLEIAPGKEAIAEARLSDWVKPTPKVGPLEQAPDPKFEELHLLCNRDKQNNLFTDTLDESQSMGEKGPYFYMIHGERPDLPNSLAERFVKFSVQEIFAQADVRMSEDKFDVIKVNLPTLSDFESNNAQKPFYRLQRNFDRAGYEKPETAADLLPFFSGFTELVIIQHSFVADNWHDGFEEFLEYYIQHFWQVRLEKTDPILIVLFDFTYTASQKGLKSFFTKSPNGALEKALEKLQKRFEACYLLDKLLLVRDGDVEQWKNDYLPEAINLTEEVCKGQSRMPMSEVQPKLREFLKLHNSRYG